MDNDGFAFVLNISNAVYAFLGSDSGAHLCEEIPNPGKNVTKVITYSLLMGRLPRRRVPVLLSIYGCESTEHTKCALMQCVFLPHVFLLVPSYSFKFNILSDRVLITLWSDLSRVYNGILCNDRSSHRLPTNILRNPTKQNALLRPIQGPSSAILLSLGKLGGAVNARAVV